MGDVTREMDALAFEGDDLREALRKERARAAELEREQDAALRYMREWQSGTHDFACESELEDATKCMTPCGCADRRVRLAAREAEVAELREAIQRYVNCWNAQWRERTSRDSEDGSDDDLDEALVKLAAILSRAPGSSDALRAVVERAVRAGLAAVGHDDGSLFYARRETSVSAIVARLLGDARGEREGA